MAKSPNENLTIKKKDLRRRIEAGEFSTILDRVADRTGRLVQRVIRMDEPPRAWVSFAAILLVVLAIDFSLSALLKEYTQARVQMVWRELMTSILLVGGTALFVAYLQHLYGKLGGIVIDSIQTEADLIDLEGWLAGMSRIRVQAAFAIGFAVLVGAPTMVAANLLTPVFWGISPILFFIFMSVPTAIVFWINIMLMVLMVRMSRYRFDLHLVDPCDSPIVTSLSASYNRLIFLMAIIMAITTLLLGSFQSFLRSWLGVFFLVMSWGPILLLFSFGQGSLFRIITRAKARTLGEIQDLINAKTANRTPGAPARGHRLDEVERIAKLVDLHDRIRKSRNTALDFQAGFNLFNSLLLPSIAFVLGNMEKIKEFFLK